MRYLTTIKNIRNDKNQLNRRLFCAGIALTGASFAFKGALTGAKTGTGEAVNRQTVKSSQKPVLYVFASDPRAGHPDYQIMPG